MPTSLAAPFTASARAAISRRAAVLARFAFVVPVLVGFAPVASAETALMLPAAGSTDRAADAERLAARVAAQLVAAGWQTRAPAGVDADRAANVLACDTSSCASAGLDVLSVDAVVAPALWQRVDGRRELTLSVQGPSGRLLELAAPVVASRPDDSADALAARLLASWPELRVRAYSVPDEAAVGEDSNPRGATHRARSPWNLPVGAGLLAASIAPIALGLAAVVREGDCVVVDEQGACTISRAGTIERFHAGPRSITMLSVGAVVAGAGVYVLVAGPIHVRPSLDLRSGSATVSLSGTF